MIRLICWYTNHKHGQQNALKLHLFFLMLSTCRLYTWFSHDYPALDKLYVCANCSYVHNLYQIKPCALALFNQAPSRTITYLKRKRWIAINREIKSFSQTSNQSIFPLPADNSAPPRSPVSCFDISPSQVNDSSADLEITKQPSHSHIQPPQYLLFSIQLCLQYQASTLRAADISAIPPGTAGQTPLITTMMSGSPRSEFSHECSAVWGGGGVWYICCLLQSWCTCSHFTRTLLSISALTAPDITGRQRLRDSI